MKIIPRPRDSVYYFSPYALQASRAMMGHLINHQMFPTWHRLGDLYAKRAQGPQWPSFPTDRALTQAEASLYRLIYAYGYRPTP